MTTPPTDAEDLPDPGPAYPEQDAADDALAPADQPAAGGRADGEPAQGEGAADSY